MHEILQELSVTPEQLCYIGDDLPDLATIKLAGLGVAVADACDEVRQAADYVTSAWGGRGAVRETIELILRAQRRWDELIQSLCPLARRRPPSRCATRRRRLTTRAPTDDSGPGLPWRRIGGSFLLMVGIYWFYALAIVPFIEPTAEAARIRRGPAGRRRH